MRRSPAFSRQQKSDLLVVLLRVTTYLGLTLLFFGLLSIRNWQLRNLSRTLGTTLLTWIVLQGAMNAIYGGYDVGRKKSKPIISSMSLGCLCVDIVTYLQLEIMNVNPDNNARLTLFGEDFLWLLLSFALQVLFLIFMVRLGNRIYFRIHQPRACLLILDSASDEASIKEKIGVYRLQWHVKKTVLWSDPELERAIEEADVVFMADIPDEQRMHLMKICYDLHRDVLCRAQLQEIMLSAGEPLVVDDALFLEMDYHKMTLFQRIVKRCMDIAVSLFVLVVFSPLMALIALAILIDDGRPVLFTQDRITVRGNTFRIRKFRTMKVQPAGEEVSAVAGDSRITRVGRLLRAFRLDELPQFWNILIGEMTLVGPRPEMLSNVEKYKSQLPTFVYREKMKAGLTGYAQIEGRYNTNPEDKLMLDLMYIESFSLWNDVRLLFRTFTVLFKPDSTKPFEAKQAAPDSPGENIQTERKGDAT